MEKHNLQGQLRPTWEHRIALKYKGSWTVYIPFGNPPKLAAPSFLVQDLINLYTQLKLSASPHNGTITCVLCVRDLTERLSSIVKQSLGFWQGKKEINVCPGEKNGSSWICCLNVIQSFSTNVLSLGQHTFIKCFLCDRHCVTSCEHRGVQDTSFILGAGGEAHQKRQACRRWFQYNVLSAMTEAVTGMMAVERRFLSSAWGIRGSFSRSLEGWVGWRGRRVPSTGNDLNKSTGVQNILAHLWIWKGGKREGWT